MNVVVFLLLQGCGAPSPAPAATCAAVDDAAETILQLTASANTQAKLLGDLKGAPDRPPVEGRFAAQGEPHRTQAHHETMFTAMCEPLVAATQALAAHAPGPHDRLLTTSAEALGKRCRDATPETGVQMQALVMGIDREVEDLRSTCATHMPTEDAPVADPEVRCAVDQKVMAALLDPVGHLQSDVTALEDQREVMRAVAAEPFDAAQVADALTQLGRIEGTFGVRCGNLIKLSEGLTRAHGGSLQSALGQLLALRKRCERIPSFDMLAPKSETQEAEAAEAGIAMRELYKSMRNAYREAFAACAATPAE